MSPPTHTLLGAVLNPANNLRIGPTLVSVGSAGQPTIVMAPIRRVGVYMSYRSPGTKKQIPDFSYSVVIKNRQYTSFTSIVKPLRTILCPKHQGPPSVVPTSGTQEKLRQQFQKRRRSHFAGRLPRNHTLQKSRNCRHLNGTDTGQCAVIICVSDFVCMLLRCVFQLTQKCEKTYLVYQTWNLCFHVFESFELKHFVALKTVKQSVK